jgi:Protein of unknown function (DUF669)
MTEHSTTLDEAFDTDVEEGTKFDLLPTGAYVAEVEEATIATTKNGEGQMVSLRLRIVEGQCEGRVVFDSMLVQHASSEAQRIGRAKFKDLCDACRITGKVTDLEVLKFKKLSIRVTVAKDKSGEYPDKNRVSRYSRYDVSTNGRGSTIEVPAATKPAPQVGEVAKDVDDKLSF